jgi:hypothetical protein
VAEVEAEIEGLNKETFQRSSVEADIERLNRQNMQGSSFVAGIGQRY